MSARRLPPCLSNPMYALSYRPAMLPCACLCRAAPPLPASLSAMCPVCSCSSILSVTGIQLWARAGDEHCAHSGKV